MCCCSLSFSLQLRCQRSRGSSTTLSFGRIPMYSYVLLGLFVDSQSAINGCRRSLQHAPCTHLGLVHVPPELLHRVSAPVHVLAHLLRTRVFCSYHHQCKSRTDARPPLAKLATIVLNVDSRPKTARGGRISEACSGHILQTTRRLLRKR